MSYERALVVTFTVLLAMVLLVPPALAHKVNVFAWREGETVHVEGYFAGDKRAQNAMVEVFAPDGRKLLEGKTDKNGEFTFEVPERTELKIVLTASMGHKNEFVLPGEEPQKAITGGAAGVEPVAGSQQGAPGLSGVDAERLESMIEAALDRKLAPLVRLVQKSGQQRFSATEIFGGIGYIFGIAGVALYFNNRRKSR